MAIFQALPKSFLTSLSDLLVLFCIYPFVHLRLSMDRTVSYLSGITTLTTTSTPGSNLTSPGVDSTTSEVVVRVVMPNRADCQFRGSHI